MSWAGGWFADKRQDGDKDSGNLSREIILSQTIFQVPPVSDPPAAFDKQILVEKAGVMAKVV